MMKLQNPPTWGQLAEDARRVSAKRPIQPGTWKDQSGTAPEYSESRRLRDAWPGCCGKPRAHRHGVVLGGGRAQVAEARRVPAMASFGPDPPVRRGACWSRSWA